MNQVYSLKQFYIDLGLCLSFYKKVILFLGMALALNACREDLQPPTSQIAQTRDCDLLSLDDFNYIGEFHNAFLDNVRDNFDPSSYPSNLTFDQKVNIVRDFHSDLIPSLGLSAEEQAYAYAGLETHKGLVDPEAAYNQLYIGSPGSPSALEGLLQMKNDGFIDNFEYVTLVKLLEAVYDNRTGALTTEGFKNVVLSLRQNWVAQGYTECSNTGRCSAYILSVALYSVNWWLANPSVLFTEGISTERVAPWVALDAGGAVLGALMATISIGGSGNFDGWGWKLGLGIGLGAINASTGIAGKIGKFIFGKTIG